ARRQRSDWMARPLSRSVCENAGCSSQHPVKQRSRTPSKLLFWPFSFDRCSLGMLPCNVALDRGGHTLRRELVGEVHHFEADDVGDVSSELRGVLSRSIPSGAAVLPDGIERPEIVVKPRNNVLRDEPPALWGIVGSPAGAYPSAEQAGAMLVHKLEDDSVTLFGSMNGMAASQGAGRDSRK